MKKYIDEGWQWVKFFILAGALVFLIQGFIFIPISVEGNSMEKTLSPNDYVIMEKFSKIKRFDIVIFQLSDGTTYIKRVVGLPGEKIIYKDDVLYVDGQAIDEPFLAKTKNNKKVHSPDFTTKEIMDSETIPADTYLVLGDNRNFSKDSRVFGGVKAEEILGKVTFIYYPFKDIGFV